MWFEELRKQCVAEMKHELARSEASIGFVSPIHDSNHDAIHAFAYCTCHVIGYWVHNLKMNIGKLCG